MNLIVNSFYSNKDIVLNKIKELGYTNPDWGFSEKSIFSKEDKQINQIRKILKSITDEQ